MELIPLNQVFRFISYGAHYFVKNFDCFSWCLACKIELARAGLLINVFA
jgi:hypothetical protein